MLIVEQLRYEIESEITTFCHNRTLSEERQRQVDAIQQILAYQDPVLLRTELISYVDQLSTGLYYYLPFVEVNKLQAGLKKVLVSSCYQETTFLTRLLQERNPQQASQDPAILVRLGKLEEAIQSQTTKINGLQQEIKRLKTENKVLTQTISMLTKNNKALSLENQRLKETTQLTSPQTSQATYDALLKENAALKSLMASQGLAPAKETAPRQSPSSTSHASKPPSTTVKETKVVKSPTSSHTVSSRRCQPEQQPNSSDKRHRLSVRG